MDEKRIAAIFKAFCDENRIRIIKLLRSGEKCACKLLEEINVTYGAQNEVYNDDWAENGLIVLCFS